MNNIDIINMIKSGQNPEQLILGLLRQQNSPMGKNLYQLASQGKTNDIEIIARNLLRQKGMDYDQAFMSFKHNLGLK